MQIESDESGRQHPAEYIPVNAQNRPVIIFITVCTKDRQPLLANLDCHQLLIEWWKKADRWLVGRYVILPDHLHLFCAPRNQPEESLRSWVAYWKNGVARHWPGVKTNPIWQRDFWDTRLRAGESYAAKWEYVRNNPVRHSLSKTAETWPFQGEINQFEWQDS